MFSYGLLVHYCLSAGKHPFGGRFERDMNILQVLLQCMHRFAFRAMENIVQLQTLEPERHFGHGRAGTTSSKSAHWQRRKI